jgi:LysM repeat protein
MTDELEVQAVDQVDDQPSSVRDEITKSINEIKERQAAAEQPEKPDEPASKPERQRNETGQFSKKEHDVQPETKQAEPEKTISAPQSWGATVKQKWNELPADVQAEIARREEEIHRGFTRLDEERNLGKQVKDVVTPYMPMLTSEGAHPVQAIQSLLNTAYILRTATPDKKAELFARLAQEYGVDMNQIPQAEYKDPHLQAIEQRQAFLEQELQRERAYKAQQENNALQSEINAFASDPKNVHFETVKAHMAALLQNGLARDLQDAYDQAVYARPDIRSTLLEAQRLESEAKRQAEIKQKTQAARAAAVSVTGAPGITVSNMSAPAESLRDELRRNLRAALNQ